MDWEKVQNDKKRLMGEVVGELNEVEKELLVWLLTEEKKNLSKGKWNYKQPLRDKLSSKVR